MPLIVLIGGARSGKSAYAVDLVRQLGGAATFVATAPALDGDMSQRIARHRDERPATWVTVEEEIELDRVLGSVPDSHTVIVDCLTLWTSNMMWNDHPQSVILSAADAVSERAAQRHRPVIVITNEVGLGIHPESELGRTYRDLLGRVNQTFARRADATLLMVAGRALRLSAPTELLEDLQLDVGLP
ncbi:MAG: bifunctional adenosylcobinamide kinase/adenosylcobinamide-phosphate guanylyltransferase [Actinomycetota bacterium]